jgi:ABC-type branched-subunit amino acid transport system substrate-binding protein
MRATRLLIPLVAALAATTVAACSATSTGSTGSTAPTVSAAPSIPSEPGPGVTASTINLTYRGYNTQTKKFTGPVVKAIINGYNAAGGIAGRQIKLVPMPFGKSDPNATTAEQAQANCLAITQASPQIFAVVSDPADVDMDPCLNSRGIPVILGSNFLVPDQLFTAAPYTAGFAVSGSHAAQALIGVLTNAGYLDGATNVAVVDSAAEAFQPAVHDTLIPGLQKAGSATVKEYTLPASSDGAKAAMSSLVLRMRADGVDRVILFGEDPGLTLLTQQMVSQKFTPRLAELGSLGASYGARAVGLQNASPDVLENLVTFFWDATAGTPQQQEQWRASDPAAQRCVQLLKAANQPASADSMFTAAPLCEGLDLLKAALEHSGSDAVNAQAFSAGIAELGSFEPVTAFAAQFSADRRDGDSSYKVMAYQTACKCFAYTGDPQPIGPSS